jgi:hypothetical protein
VRSKINRSVQHKRLAQMIVAAFGWQPAEPVTFLGLLGFTILQIIRLNLYLPMSRIHLAVRSRLLRKDLEEQCGLERTPICSRATTA